MSLISFIGSLNFDANSLDRNQNFLRAVDFTAGHQAYSVFTNTTSEWTIKLNSSTGGVAYIKFLPETFFVSGPTSSKGPPAGDVDAIGLYNSNGDLIGGFLDLGGLNAWVEDFVDTPQLLVNGDDAFAASTTGPVTFHGGLGNDLIIGDTGADHLYGDAGNDDLDGGAGADVLVGGAGDDFYYVDVAGDVVTESSGGGTADAVFSSVANWTLGANIENLGLLGESDINGTGNSLANILLGNAGANILSGAAGADYLVGGDGDDTLQGGASADRLEGGLGADDIDGGDGADTVTYAQAGEAVVIALGPGSQSGGEASGDILSNVENVQGSAFNDTLTGDSGANTLDGYNGADTLSGGGGNDTYLVSSSTDQTIESDSGGIDLVKSTTGWTLGAFIENLLLTGSKVANGTGNGLDNDLTGNGAANVLRGLAGADTLDGVAGDDTLYGGAGNDTYLVNSSTDHAFEDDAGGGVDLVKSTTSWALGDFIENLTLTGSKVVNGTGNALDNIITGNSAANVLNGVNGADTLYGGAGNDTYIVNSSTDQTIETSLSDGTDLVKSTATWALGANLENLTLIGAAAIKGTGNTLDNVIIGNSAANIIAGGSGHDTLTGGGGADAFVFASASAKNSDTIADFTSGEDKIRLDNAVFTGLADGALSSDAFYAGAAAHDGDDRVIYNSATGALYYDGDGNGAGRSAILIATLTTHPTLAASDIVVI